MSTHGIFLHWRPSSVFHRWVEFNAQRACTVGSGRITMAAAASAATTIDDDTVDDVDDGDDDSISFVQLLCSPPSFASMSSFFCCLKCSLGALRHC